MFVHKTAFFPLASQKSLIILRKISNLTPGFWIQDSSQYLLAIMSTWDQCCVLGIILWMKNIACHIRIWKMLQPPATNSVPKGEPWRNSGWKHRMPTIKPSVTAGTFSSAPLGDSGRKRTRLDPRELRCKSNEWLQWAQTLASFHT